MCQNLRSAELRFPRRVAASFNQSMKPNRRGNSANTAELGFGHTIHAPPLLSAAVAYFCRSPSRATRQRLPSQVRSGYESQFC
jgi:hypothetical protein